MSFKMAHLILQLQLPGANELKSVASFYHIIVLLYKILCYIDG